MKKWILICICLMVASCGMFQPVESQKQYLQVYFPNCRITPIEEMLLVYVVTDTLHCESWVVEMSEWKKNTITKIETRVK